MSVVEAPIELPDGLARMRPGPELSALLATVDSARLTRAQLTVVAAARCRQISYEQAELLVTLRELGHAPPEVHDRVVREPRQSPFWSIEVAFASTWTLDRCEKMMNLAQLALDRAPALGEALSAGRIDLEKLNVFYSLLHGVADDATIRQIVDLAIGERRGSESVPALRARVRRLLARLDPDALRKRRERDHEERFVGRDIDRSGLVTLFARFLDPVKATAVFDNIDAIARATLAAGDPLGRNLEQLRTDILCDLGAGVEPAKAGYAEPADRKGTIILTIDLATLAQLDDEPADIAGFGPITAHLARQTALQLAATSVWRFAVTDGGRLLAEGALPRALDPRRIQAMTRYAADADAGPDGRAHRYPTADQIAFVRARDKLCQAPGCTVPAHRCEIDHRVPWILGGPTIVDNLYCLCKRHHRAKDTAGYSYRPGRDGLVWTAPSGLTYLRAREPAYRRRRRHRYDVVRCPVPITIDLDGHSGAGHLRR